MSDSRRHRYTQKATRHEARRRTLRSQTGGGTTNGFTWYHIEDPERAKNWNTVLGIEGSGLEQFAGVFTTADWGTLTPSQKLELYIKLVERQDEMFRMALNIIYAKLDINPQSETLLGDVIDKLPSIESLGEANLKAYIMDVFSLITGVRPGSQEMVAVLKLDEKDIYGEKLARIMKDPLPQILLWPERVSNVFVEYIARGLIELKKDHTELDAVLAERDSAVKKTKQEAFASARNAYMQANAVLTTSLGLRDGFFLWQKMAYPEAPMDTCPKDQRASCGQTGVADISFWYQFCNQMKTSISDDESYFKGANKISILFSRLVAHVYKIYKDSNIDAVRAALLNPLKFANGTTLTSDSTYRPRDIVAQEIPGANVLRVLDPTQYTFLLHLVHTMRVLEKERAPAESSSAATPVAAASPEAPAAAAAAPSQEVSSNPNTKVSSDKITRSSRATAKKGKSITTISMSVPYKRSLRIAAAEAAAAAKGH